MHVVIVDGDVSYPPTSGKRLRTLNLMLKLASRHRITYVGRCAAHGEEDQTAPKFLRDHDIEPILVHHPIPKKSGLGFYSRLAGNLFSRMPYSVASHQSAVLRRTLAELARRQSVDLWQLEWQAYLPMVERAWGPRLVMAHNVDTLIWRRYYETARGMCARMYLQRQWQKWEAFEGEAFRAADRVVAVSEGDADLVRNRFGQDRVNVVDNGIDRAFFEQAQGTRDPRCLLFLGALDWRPNLDAVDVLLDRIFPQVRLQEPQARLQIVGRNPPQPLAQRIAKIPGVELYANVADVRPFLAQAGVMTVPLRIGGGSRLKILEALACGLPVVSTRVGAEGLNLTEGEHLVLAEEDQLADALVRAVREPSSEAARAAKGQALVLEKYDWGVLAKKLEQAWIQCAADRQPRHGEQRARSRILVGAGW